jgi:hypothetical protein
VERALKVQSKLRQQNHQVRKEEKPLRESVSAAAIAKVLPGIDFPKTKDKTNKESTKYKDKVIP